MLCSQGALNSVQGGKRARFLQDALSEYYRGEARKFLVQSGVCQRLLDEKPTKFFFSTVKGRQKHSSMDCLKTATGKVFTVEGMLNASATFYKELFADRERRGATAELFLNYLDRTLEDVERGELEEKVTLEEVEKAVRSLKRGTSPGCDGLPSEFYQTFWPLVGPELVKVYQ